MDLALTVGTDVENPVEGDLALDRGQLHLATGDQAVAQHQRVRLRFFLGEWFLDQTEGIPFFRDIFVKAPSTRLVTSIFRDVLLGTPGTASLDRFSLTLDARTRAAFIEYTALLDSGGVVEGDFDVAFVLEVT